MNPATRKPAALLIATMVLLAGLSISCGGGVGVEYHFSTSLSGRWVTGFVYDEWTGHPIRGAEVVVEDDLYGDMWLGYTDYDGYFDIYVGDYYDCEDVGFRVYRIAHPDYYTYHADSTWYLVGYSAFIDTGDYLLDWR